MGNWFNLLIRRRAIVRVSPVIFPLLTMRWTMKFISQTYLFHRLWAQLCVACTGEFLGIEPCTYPLDKRHLNRRGVTPHLPC